jgi:hypothetical protein
MNSVYGRAGMYFLSLFPEITNDAVYALSNILYSGK